LSTYGDEITLSVKEDTYPRLLPPWIRHIEKQFKFYSVEKCSENGITF
jgi:hypothetical protein